jgi:hypothetical protein
LYTKSKPLPQEENPEFLGEESKQAIQFLVAVGDLTKCPECETIGRVVWVSSDKKTMGVRCPASHQGHNYQSKYGGALTVTKARKNVVFLTPIKQKAH